MFRGILDLPGFDWVHLVWNPPVTEGSVPFPTQATSCVSQFLKLQDPLQPKVRSKEFKCKPWRFEDGEAKKLRNTSGKVSNKLPAAFLLRILRLEDVSSGRKNQKHMLTRSFKKKNRQTPQNGPCEEIWRFGLKSITETPKRRNPTFFTRKKSPSSQALQQGDLELPVPCTVAAWTPQVISSHVVKASVMLSMHKWWWKTTKNRFVKTWNSQLLDPKKPQKPTKWGSSEK